MKYLYKTVMLNEFAHGEGGKDFLAKGFSLDVNQKAGKLVEALLNYYAKDGWEYWRNETFPPIFFQSVSSMLFNIAPETPHIPVFIFRKALTEETKLEIQREFEEEEKRLIEASKPKINDNGTWTCPKSGHDNPMPIGSCRYCGFDAANMA